MSLVRTSAAVLTAALFALVLTGRAPAADAPRGGDDLQYLPDDTNLMFVIRMDQLLATDGYKRLLKEVPRIEKEFEEAFRKEFGFDLGNVERMMMGANVKGNRPLGVFWLKKAVDAKVVRKAREEPRFKGDKGMPHKEEKVGALTMYVPDQEFREAFCFPNDKTLVFGTPKDIKAVLARNKKPDLSTGLQAALKEADPTAMVTFAMDVKAVFDDVRGLKIPGVDLDKLKDAASGASLTIKFGTEVSARGVAVCKDAKAAEETRTQAEAFLTAILAELKKVPGEKAPKELLDLPNKVKLTTRGNLVEATGAVSVDLAIAYFKSIGPGPEPNPNPKPIEDKKPIGMGP